MKSDVIIPCYDGLVCVSCVVYHLILNMRSLGQTGLLQMILCYNLSAQQVHGSIYTLSPTESTHEQNWLSTSIVHNEQ